MRPGKHPTPTEHLDLEALWRALGEEPPGKIVQIGPRRTEKDANSKNGTRRTS